MARASSWLSLVMEVRNRQDNWNPRLSPTFVLAISRSIPPQHSLNKRANVRPSSPGIVKWTAMGKAAWGSRLPVPYTNRRPEFQSPLPVHHLHNLEWCAWLLSPRPVLRTTWDGWKCWWAAPLCWGWLCQLPVQHASLRSWHGSSA